MSNGIGNVEHAREILEWIEAEPGESDWDLSPRVRGRVAPEGWEYVGRGSFRSVWRSPEGVAYKIAHRFRQSRYENGREYDNLVNAWHRGAPEGCRLPRFGKFDIGESTILAMELIDGVTLYEADRQNRAEGLFAKLRACEIKFNLRDLHGENAIVESGTGLLVPIDFGG